MQVNHSAASLPALTPWGWSLAGAITGLALALLVFAPARLLAIVVEQASAGHVLLQAPRGSVWQGSAQLVFSGGEGSRDAVTLPGQLTWRIRPNWRGVAVQLNADCCMRQPLQLKALPAGWRGARLELADSQSQWPAGLMAGLGTPWNTVQVQGQLQASTQGFTVQWLEGRMSVAGQVQVDASQISSRLSTLRPMGSYRLVLLGGPQPTLDLTTLEGSLQIKGKGQWIGQRLRFDGAASATPESVDALSNLLNLIGRRSGASSIIKVG